MNHTPRQKYAGLRQCNCDECMDKELAERAAERERMDRLRARVDRVMAVVDAHEGLRAIGEILRGPTLTPSAKWDSRHEVTDTHVHCHVDCTTERGPGTPTCALCGPRPKETK